MLPWNNTESHSDSLASVDLSAPALVATWMITHGYVTIILNSVLTSAEQRASSAVV